MNNESFELEIISPTSNRTEIVEWVEVESPTGSFFVGPNHSPLVSLIKNKSHFSYKQVGLAAPQSFIVHEGVFRVSEENKAKVILTA
jgi:F0F1-type ATP synthase epsilon subunit